MGIFDAFSSHNSAAVQRKLFRLNESYIPLNKAVQAFGELCYEFSKGVPQSAKELVCYRIVVDRNSVTAQLSIDELSGHVNFRKIIPGFKLASFYGWDNGPKYLEGMAQSISLLDEWDGRDLSACIEDDFKRGCPNATVINRYDDILSTRQAGVIIRIK